MISSFLVHECEGSSRIGSRPRRYLFTGHSTGAVQVGDLWIYFLGFLLVMVQFFMSSFAKVGIPLQRCFLFELHKMIYGWRCLSVPKQFFYEILIVQTTNARKQQQQVISRIHSAITLASHVVHKPTAFPFRTSIFRCGT